MAAMAPAEEVPEAEAEAPPAATPVVLETTTTAEEKSVSFVARVSNRTYLRWPPLGSQK